MPNQCRWTLLPSTWTDSVQFYLTGASASYMKIGFGTAIRTISQIAEISAPIALGSLVTTITAGAYAYSGVLFAVSAGGLVIISVIGRFWSSRMIDAVSVEAMVYTVSALYKCGNVLNRNDAPYDTVTGIVRSSLRAAWSWQVIGQTIFGRIIPTLFVAIFVTGYLFTLSEFLATLFLVWVLLFLYTSFVLCHGMISREARVALTLDAELSSALQNDLASDELPPMEHQSMLIELWSQKNISWLYSIAFASFIQNSFSAVGQILLIGVTVWFWSGSQITTGTLTAVIAILAITFSNWSTVGQNLRVLQRAAEPATVFHQLPSVRFVNDEVKANE